MNGEFQGLSIDNIFDLNGAWSGLEWLGAYFTNTPFNRFLIKNNKKKQKLIDNSDECRLKSNFLIGFKSIIIEIKQNNRLSVDIFDYF